MRLSKVILVTIVIVLVASVWNRELWWSEPWRHGLVIGWIAAWASCANSAARIALGLLGMSVLILAAFGQSNVDWHGRALFGGMSLGLLLGYLCAPLLFRAKSAQWLSLLAEQEDSETLRKWARRLTR